MLCNWQMSGRRRAAEGASLPCLALTHRCSGASNFTMLIQMALTASASCFPMGGPDLLSSHHICPDQLGLNRCCSQACQTGAGGSLVCVHLPVTHPGALPGTAALPHHLVGGCWAVGDPNLLHPAA